MALERNFKNTLEFLSRNTGEGTFSVRKGVSRVSGSGSWGQQVAKSLTDLAEEFGGFLLSENDGELLKMFKEGNLA